MKTNKEIAKLMLELWQGLPKNEKIWGLCFVAMLLENRHKRITRKEEDKFIRFMKLKNKNNQFYDIDDELTDDDTEYHWKRDDIASRTKFLKKYS